MTNKKATVGRGWWSLLWIQGQKRKKQNKEKVEAEDTESGISPNAEVATGIGREWGSGWGWGWHHQSLSRGEDMRTLAQSLEKDCSLPCPSFKSLPLIFSVLLPTGPSIWTNPPPRPNVTDLPKSQGPRFQAQSLNLRLTSFIIRGKHLDTPHFAFQTLSSPNNPPYPPFSLFFAFKTSLLITKFIFP